MEADQLQHNFFCAAAAAATSRFEPDLILIAAICSIIRLQLPQTAAESQGRILPTRYSDNRCDLFFSLSL